MKTCDQRSLQDEPTKRRVYRAVSLTTNLRAPHMCDQIE